MNGSPQAIWINNKIFCVKPNTYRPKRTSVFKTNTKKEQRVVKMKDNDYPCTKYSCFSCFSLFSIVYGSCSRTLKYIAYCNYNYSLRLFLYIKFVFTLRYACFLPANIYCIFTMYCGYHLMISSHDSWSIYKQLQHFDLQGTVYSDSLETICDQNSMVTMHDDLQCAQTVDHDDGWCLDMSWELRFGTNTPSCTNAFHLKPKEGLNTSDKSDKLEFWLTSTEPTTFFWNLKVTTGRFWNTLNKFRNITFMILHSLR